MMTESPASSDMELEQARQSEKATDKKAASKEAKSGHNKNKESSKKKKGGEGQQKKSLQSLTEGLGLEQSHQPPHGEHSNAAPQEGPRALGLAKGVSVSMPDVSLAGVGPSQRARPGPSATFTPTAAGLRTSTEGPAPPPMDFQAMFSTALSSILTAGIQQNAQIASQPAPKAQPRSHDGLQRRAAETIEDNDESSSSEGEEIDPADLPFSDDEEAEPEVPTYTGLFRPALFFFLNFLFFNSNIK